MSRPTIFYILENRDLGTWWVGKMTTQLDKYGWSIYRPITQQQLDDKLREKYDTFSNPSLNLTPVNHNWLTCYGVERWLSKLEYNISKESKKLLKLKELLMAGWNGESCVSTLSVLHIFDNDQPIDKIFKKLMKSRYGLTKCLNTFKNRMRERKRCVHDNCIYYCKICKPHNYLVNQRRTRRWALLKNLKNKKTIEELCMTSLEWLNYLHSTFENRYGRRKTESDDVHIDEIIPCSAWNLPEDNKYCWHYLNSQWLLAEDNLKKHNSYTESDKLDMIQRITSVLTYSI